MTLQVTDVGDGHLIESYRAGDEAAADELFRRHHRAALRLARSIVGDSGADDVASESFVRVLQALRNGHGPQLAFRPYLLTTVRNTSYEVVRKASRDVLVDDVDDVTGAHDDGGYALHGESQVLSRAFHALPERWQVVLWHTAVDGEPPAKVAEVLGIRPTAVAALAYRAREGLRQAYIAEHVPDTTAPRCARVREKLPAHLRRQLSPVASARIVAHLESCPWCAVVEQDLRALSGDLGAVLAPALLGGAALSLGGTAVVAGGGVVTGVFSHLPLHVAQTVGATTAAVVVAGVAVSAGPTTTLGPGSEPVPQAAGSFEAVEPPSSAVRAPDDGRPGRGTPVTAPTSAPASPAPASQGGQAGAPEAGTDQLDLVGRLSDVVDGVTGESFGGGAPVTEGAVADTLAAAADVTTQVGERLVDRDDWRSLVSFDYTATEAGARLDLTLAGHETSWSLTRPTLAYGGWECRRADDTVLRCAAESAPASALWSGLRLDETREEPAPAPAAAPAPSAAPEKRAVPRQHAPRPERRDREGHRERSGSGWSWFDLESWRDRHHHSWGW